MEEEDHFTQSQLPALLLHLQLLPLQPFTFTLLSSHSHSFLYHFALSRMPINRQVWWLLFFNNSSCTWVDTFVNGGCNYHWQMVTLLFRVGCPIMANPNNIEVLAHLQGPIQLISGNLQVAGVLQQFCQCQARSSLFQLHALFDHPATCTEIWDCNSLL